MRLGAVWVRSGKTCAGVYQGSLLLSTPGQPHSLVLRPCGGVSLCTRTGSTLAALPKAAPHRWHSRSVGATSGPVSGRTAGGGTKIKKCTSFSNILTCAVGRSSVRVVPHTAGMKFQGAQPLWLYSYCNRENFGFLEEISHN